MTGLQKDVPREEMRTMDWIDEKGNTPSLFKTPDQGASTTIWCAAAPDPDSRGGAYCEDCSVALPTAPGTPWAGFYPHPYSPRHHDDLACLFRNGEGLLYLN